MNQVHLKKQISLIKPVPPDAAGSFDLAIPPVEAIPTDQAGPLPMQPVPLVPVPLNKLVPVPNRNSMMQLVP